MSNELSIAGVGITNLARDSNRTMGVIPAQTQLSTALAINLGLDGQSVIDDHQTIKRQTGVLANLVFELIYA